MLFRSACRQFHKRFACLPLGPIGRLMNTHSHDFVTVDMRGLKAALVARAHAQRVSVSVLVRDAVAHELGFGESSDAKEATNSLADAVASPTVKLSIRFTPGEAAQLAAGARSAGLSRGAYLAGLIGGVAALSGGASRADHLAEIGRAHV